MLKSAASKVMWPGRTKALVFGLAMAGTFLLVFLSGAALATSFALEAFRCTDLPCHGTSAFELIGERKGKGKQDDIRARGGSDKVNAHRWGNDKDVLRGQKGNFDFLNSKDGDGRDVLMCGSGTQDAVKADPGDTISDGCDTFVGAAASQVNVVSEAKAEQIAANRLK
jgi:hypothetical protein